MTRPTEFCVELDDKIIGFRSDRYVFSVEDVVSFYDEFFGEAQEIAIGQSYRLSHEDLRFILEKYNVPIRADAMTGHIRRAILVDYLPYLPHTNRELPMMLEGKKPFASFDNISPQIESAFEPFVLNGAFTHEKFTLHIGEEAIEYTMYALPGDAWRIQSFKLLKMISAETGWNATLERLEGALYGYDQAQRNYYMKEVYAKISNGNQS